MARMFYNSYSLEKITHPFTLFSGLLPAICGLCYGLVLIFNRESRSKRMLGVIMLLSGVCWGTSMIMDNLTQANGRTTVFNTWHILSDLLTWPLIRWYSILIFRPDARFWQESIKMFIPFFAGLVCALIVRAVWGAVPDVYSMREFFSLLWVYPEFILRMALLAVFIAQTTVFFIRAVRDLSDYRRRIRNDFSELEDMDLRWVYWVIYILFIFPVFNLALAFSGDVTVRMGIYVWGFICLGAVAVFGGTRKDIYYLPNPGVSLDKQPLRSGKTALFIPPGMEALGINHQTFSKVGNDLARLMDEESVYTKQDLRLDDLAAMLNTNKTYVSAVINNHYKTNFHTLVNRQRVKKAEKLLVEGMRIKEVWTFAGFNSQRSFNTVFKKFTGTTPSQWIGDRQKNAK